MDNKRETLKKIAKIRKETEKLREDIKRLQEKVVQIKSDPWLLMNRIPVNKFFIEQNTSDPKVKDFFLWTIGSFQMWAMW